MSGYCERIDPSFWAEPVNAVTNAAFIIVALLALLRLQRSGRHDRPVFGLALLVLTIGVGSFLFHTMPRRWTLLADVVPIQLFALAYFGLALNRFLGLRPVLAGLGALAFLAGCVGMTAIIAPSLPAAMRGSAGYAGFLLGLFGVAFAVWWRGRAPVTARLLGLAGVVFALSLSFRSLDHAACDVVPFGLHWGWHLLNALLIHLLLRAAFTHPDESRRAA